MATKSIASATVRAVKKRMLPSRAALVLTPTAVQKVKEIMSKEEAKGFIGLKVGVRQRGCNGLSYTLDYASTKGKLDEEVKQDGVTIIIDKKAQLTLLGMYTVHVLHWHQLNHPFYCPFVYGYPEKRIIMLVKSGLVCFTVCKPLRTYILFYHITHF